MLPLMPVVTRYREMSGIRFELVGPNNPDLGRLFVNANWAFHIDPDGFEPNRHRGGHVPAVRFLDDGDYAQDAILDRVMTAGASTSPLVRTGCVWRQSVGEMERRFGGVTIRRCPLHQHATRGAA